MNKIIEFFNDSYKDNYDKFLNMFLLNNFWFKYTAIEKLNKFLSLLFF